MAYALDRLGWLQFEQLCAAVVGHQDGTPGWRGRTGGLRVCDIDHAVTLAELGIDLQAPVTVAAAWVAAGPSPLERLETFVWRMDALHKLGPHERVLVLTNLDGPSAERALAASAMSELAAAAVVLGADELSLCVDRRADLRAAMPSLLGLRDLGPLLELDVRERSSLDVDDAQALARVFVATGAYARARAVIVRHRFVVLTGPPEVGKTAIARMLALAQLTDGWEAHECRTPEALWRVFDRARAQVFVADDAFGSTEYRPDAAEHWARELGRVLTALDDRHWLIWTSRPAPLKAGLRRVQRERGSERFPAPAEVLVDASRLDLAEKTLILFRHAQDHGVSSASRTLVRDAGAEIVEHEHFTPERIRRFVAGSLDSLAQQERRASNGALLLRAIERELATPTAAMATSFAALTDEHRALLIALLDVPAGMADARELAAALRRHHPGGLSRAPDELVDRLTDHFLRVSALGIGWVHPSWRDLVIVQLVTDASAREHFLRSCGVHGAMLALSSGGGAAGERLLPLMVGDRDWDALTDRLGELLRSCDDHDGARLLVALAGAVEAAERYDRDRVEVGALADYALGAARRAWDKQGRQLSVSVVQAWYELCGRAPQRHTPPQLRATWTALRPAPPFRDTNLAIAQADEWLGLVETLTAHDPAALERLGFGPNEDTSQLLSELVNCAAAAVATGSGDRFGDSLIERVLKRIQTLSPGHTARAVSVAAGGVLSDIDIDARWWVPGDLAAPPTSEPVSRRARFTRTDIARVLADL